MAKTSSASRNPVQNAVQAAPTAAKMTVTMRVNGEPCTLTVAPWTTLLDALRDRLNLTGTKKGCDQGQCGPVPSWSTVGGSSPA